MKKVAILITIVVVIGCISKKIATNNVVKTANDEYLLNIPKGLIEPDIPFDNKLTLDKIALGKKLFFEKNLSKNRDVSCATCHSPSYVFSENLTTSIRSEVAENILPNRNSISVVNSGFQATLGWGGQFSSLENQVIGSFLPYGDMGIDIGEAIKRIDNSEYNILFKAVFPKDGLSVENFAKAIATYERSLLSGNTKFDDFLFGNKQQSLNSSEKNGFELFIGKASCIACHDIFHSSVNSLGGGIALFTDHRFHNLGIGYENGRFIDAGRYLVTQDKKDLGSFKTPSLRNVALTSPYMHNGSLKTLEDVVEFYNKGGAPNPNISSGLKNLFLTKNEVNDIVAFLKTLTDEKYCNNN